MIQYLLTYNRKRQYLLLFVDCILLLFSIILAYFIRVYINERYPNFFRIFENFNIVHIIVIIIHLLFLYILDQYNLDRLNRKIKVAVLVIIGIIISGIAISGVLFFFPKYIFGRQVLLIHLFIASILLISWRRLFSLMLLNNKRYQKLALIGKASTISYFLNDIYCLPNSGFEITKICFLENLEGGEMIRPESIEVVGSIQQLIEDANFDALAFDSSFLPASEEDIRRIIKSRFQGKAIHDLHALYKNIMGKVPVSEIDGRWLLNSEGLQGVASTSYRKIKRLFDLSCSLIFLILSSPLCLIIAFAIKLESKGSIFFSQERLGYHRKPFVCYKFRTMISDAEKYSGPVWSSDDDPRITRVGRLLRKSRLDELPQLFNVLKGDLSVVGPRPIREYFARSLEKQIPFYDLRFNIKPGLTGWAQVNHGYAGSEDGQYEKFQYELFYIQNMSILLDFFVLAKTIRTVLKGTGK